MSAFCHATIIVGIQMTQYLEEKLINIFGEDFKEKIFLHEIFDILPFDACQTCETIFGIVISDIDESGEIGFEEIKDSDIDNKQKDLRLFLKLHNIELDTEIKIFNIQHWV